MSINPRPTYLLLVPLLISAFTHLWNPLGFPSFWYVEEIYLQRAMYVLHGLGTTDPSTTYGHPYDHPYFGQLLLAGLLKIINYPDSLDLSPSIPSSQTPNDSGEFSNSINLLHFIPRLLIGSLAIIDTFLIYKISEHSYHSTTVAFIASILFAIMPMTWLMRKILLENLLLPLLLSSILFAVYYRKSTISKSYPIKIKTKQTILILISGIFMGLAIFTKLPALTMIPLVGFLLFNSTNKNLKHLALWIIPVTLIPLIWSFDAVLNGELDSWLRDMLWQIQRQGESLLLALTTIFQIDPVLFILAIAGLIYAEIKRDYLILLWTIPFLIFLFLVGFVGFFYLILLMPLFSIAASRLIVDIVNKFNNKKNRRIVFSTVILSIAIFGLLNTSLLITTNVSSSYLEVYAFVVQHIVQNKVKDNIDDNTDDKPINERKTEIPPEHNDQRTTLIGNQWTRAYYWIPKYVFDIDFDIILLPSSISSPPIIHTEKVLLMLDNHILRSISYKENPESQYLDWIREVNSSTSKIAVFTEKSPIFKEYDRYPYSGSLSHSRGIAPVEFRAN
jgi:hypothetical protein